MDVYIYDGCAIPYTSTRYIHIYIHILMQGNIAIMCDYASLTKTKKTLHMRRRSLREMSIVF